MIQYNTKDWATYIFRFHKSDTFTQLIPLMLFIGLYCGAIIYIELYYLGEPHSDHVKNLTMMHGMLGFVISLLLAYRTNTAYDRWWEGRKLWGELTNNCRNLSFKLAVILKDENDRAYFRKLIPAYASILQKHLRSDETANELFDGLDLQIDHHKHRPNQVAKMMFQKIHDLHKKKEISDNELLFLNLELKSFTDICGACERIKNTPIPYSYSAFIKKFIFIYVMTLPFGYALNLGFYAVPVVIFTFYVLASLELIAEEIEDPFGSDPNDLPTVKITSNIKKHVEEIL